MRVIVVGGGVMGLATARALVKGGHEVTVLERGPIPNPLGSSVDQHRVIRYAYGELHGYAAMIGDAYAAWERLWADLGRRHYVETGHLIIGPDDDPWIKGSLASLERLGVAFEALDGAALRRRFPHVAAEEALFAPEGGALLAERIVAGLATWLRGAGGAVRERAEVVEVDPERARCRLAGGEVVAGDALLVAAGPWIGRLAPALAAKVAPSRQVVVYVRAPDPALAAAWARGPVISDKRDAIFYALPPVAGTGLKFGDHSFSGAGDVDGPREATAAEIESVMALGRARLARGGEYTALHARTCFYTVSEDERFQAHREGATLALSPCSGHGFKFAALFGERAAEAVTGRREFDGFARWLAGEEG